MTLQTPFHPVSRQRLCDMCDTVNDLPSLLPGEQAHCRCCGHTLASRVHSSVGTPLALALTALILLAFSMSYEYISFSASGIARAMTLIQAVTAPIALGYPILTIIFGMGVVLLPACYLLGVVYLHLFIGLGKTPPNGIYVARLLHYVTAWMMPDIFVIGVLVSLVKIMSLASIGFGLAFWTFCAFAVCMLATTRRIDHEGLWKRLSGPIRAPHMNPDIRGKHQRMTTCTVCGQPGQVDANGRGRCQRCREPLHARKHHSLQITLALLLVSIMLYIPSMAWPVMHIHQLSDYDPQTIIGGVILLITHGDIPIALVIFFASVMVPVAKLLALFWLCWKTRHPLPFRYKHRMWLYHVTEFIGRWSMIDVFVVTVLASLVQLSSLMSIQPGHGIVAFAAVVIVTMVAAERFDPRLLWDAAEIAFRRQGMTLDEAMDASKNTPPGQEELADVSFDRTQKPTQTP